MANASPNFQHILYSVDGCVASVKYNRPKKKNAVSQLMFEELAQALQLAGKDDNVTMVTLTGAGDYYSSGNDLNTFLELDPENIEESTAATYKRLDNYIGALIDCPKLLIGIVNGPAVGIAVTSLAHFDLVYASDNATFNTPFSSLGQSPEACSSYLFPRLMGYTKAAEILSFGRKISAQEAKERNLVTEVFPKDSLHREVQMRIEGFKEFSRLSLLQAKKLIRGPERSYLHEVHDKEMDVLRECTKSPECMEAVMKFFSKRQPAAKL